MTINNEHNKLNVPNLRFPEFQGEWEKCILGDITENFNLRNKDKIQYPMFSVTNDRGFVPQSEQFEGRDMVGEDIKAYKIIHTNDFAYNPARINVGSIAMYTGEKPCMISSLYVCFKTTKEVNNEWLMQLLKTPKMNYYYNVNGEGGVRVYLFYPNFARIRMSIPKIEEQKKIAKLLNLIDERIATQNKIIDKLQSLIKGIVDCTILHKEKNAIVGDVCSISEQIRAEANIDDIITVRLHGNGVCKSSAENLQLGATQYYRRKAGQLIYGKQNFHNGAIGIVPISLDNGITSKDIPSFDIDEMKCNSVYLLAQLQSPQYYKPAEALTTGTGSKRLKEETFLKMPIVLPNKREQDNIAVLIHRASMNLEHAKRLLVLLSIQKQFLLRQMFI